MRRMSDKKFSLPKINLPEISAELRKKLLISGAALAAVCAACALLLSGVNLLLTTLADGGISPSVREVMERLLPAEEYAESDFDFSDTSTVIAVYEAKNGNESAGWCAYTSASDYDGEMHAVVAIDGEGKVLAVEIVSMPDGVGEKVRSASFLSLFTGKSGKLTSVTGAAKDDTQISAISDETEASSAVCDCVNSALSAVSRISAERAKEVASE